MRKPVCLVLALLLVLGCSVAWAQGTGTVTENALNPENYPWFLVLSIRQTDDSSPIVVTGCFGDYVTAEDAEVTEDMQALGFDRENPLELLLADSCEILLPADFSDNIMDNLPCEDILQWYADRSEEVGEPITFNAEVTLDETNQVIKLEYVYFPWG